MLRLTSSPFSLSFPSISNLNLLPSFPPTSLFYLPSSSTTFHTTSLRIHTPPPLSSSLSSFSVDQTTSISQMQDNLLLYSRAYWLTQSLIAWNVDHHQNGICYLLSSKDASLNISNSQIQGEDLKIKLQEDKAGLPANVVEKFPHIRGYKAFNLPPGSDIKSLLKSQLAVVIYDSDEKCRDCTGLQLPGVLDELFSYNGPLGALFSEEAVSLYLWAPTAQSVRAYIYKHPSGDDPIEIVPLEEEHGVWRTKGPKSWEGCYYVYEVCVYHPSTSRVEKCYANDPYARGLSSDGRRTFLLNLDSNELKPDRWENLADEKPILHSFSDISIYELHIRDFSANDLSVQPEFRGGYLAFTLTDSAGVLHLKKLSSAGITHVHLLPTFQFAGVDDQKENWRNVDTSVLESFPPDSDQQQALITAIQNFDGYNWGYNPVLWGVPKGSYASNPNGPNRTIEFRKMVQALSHIGLRVVLDTVYNHLQGNGPFDEHSVLDKIVPGYYLRRNTDGFIENSTCMNNTASEHSMVERLILDDLLHWAVNYKVDGFRFDLMGHIMKSTMVKAKNALQRLTKEKDGVDGSSIYIYGEGWDFGEVAKNGRGINASQFNLAGTQIGSFNDRIRDSVLGGSPFGHPLQQGFVTGLLLQPNGHDHGTEANMKSMLAASMDHIQIGMAGNLKDFVLTNSEGEEVKGSEVLTYGGTPVAFASYPIETVNYVSAHDNETLFDIVSLKTPMDIGVAERCRINHLATSVIALSQGIPFFHSGDEILRSKSLDRDSYNSGDWFNRLDFTYNSNNWGVGLPPQEKNEKHWSLMKPRLADPSFRPQRIDILATMDNFLNLLRIRYSSALFRLRTANAIQQRVRFHNTGPSLVSGVIVMSIEDGHDGFPGLSQLDPIYSFIVVVFNASPQEVSFVSPSLQSRNLQLHPIQEMSSDELVKSSKYEASSGCFVVSRRTTAVFVEPRKM
ncbi:alpha-1,6-glucosidase, pullulanase-type protein [Medicago truncatula]|uniref:Alpha-1,6-glucosidase, pullulanase-type protein n=2 Tax=Medicago truncatula TaxID=3880 RepID=A0A072VMS0_MEDTR|nr:alpha-1,6-glucosidase, pullulanase-type protein [Medicago truncatula]